MNQNRRDQIIVIVLTLAIGVVVWKLSTIIPHPITINGIDIGDIGVPLYSLSRWIDREPIYNLQATYENIKIPLQSYPFTSSILMAPFLLFPSQWIAPLCNSLFACLLAYGILKKKEFWRLLVFFSFPYISAIHSVQWAPLIAAALYLPALLPVAIVKPQLGISMVVAVNWKKRAILIVLSLILVSLILYPRWIFDFLAFGFLQVYTGWIPITISIGIFLLLAILRWRNQSGRLLLSMSVLPQRLWYDQFLVMFVPRNAVEQILLTLGSWAAILLSKYFGFITYFGDQDRRAVLLVIIFIYIPALIMVLLNRKKEEPIELVKFIDKFINKIRLKIPRKA